MHTFLKNQEHSHIRAKKVCIYEYRDWMAVASSDRQPDKTGNEHEGDKRSEDG